MRLKQPEFVRWQVLHALGLLTMFCVAQACTKSSETSTKTSTAAVVPSGAKIVPSGSKIVPMGTVDLSKSGSSVAKPVPPVVQDKSKDKPVPTLAGLNAAATYVPAPEDLSPEGFNWLHRDLALIYSGAIYEEGYDGKWRDTTLRERLPAIEAYLGSLKAIKRAQFDAWAEPHRLSFLINAYHAHVLKLMVEQDFKNLDDKLLAKPATVTLFDASYSLEQFVTKELLTKYKDPRLYLSLYCFSERCPPLRNSVYNYKKLESMLSTSTTRFIRNEQKNRLDMGNKTLTLSPVVYRYKDLIERDGQTLATFLASYVSADGANKEAPELLKRGELKLN